MNEKENKKERLAKVQKILEGQLTRGNYGIRITKVHPCVWDPLEHYVIVPIENGTEGWSRHSTPIGVG